MSFWRYLRDNIRFLLLGVVLAASLPLMVWLDGNSHVQPGNAVYAGLVSFALLIVCVALDFSIRRRQALRLAALVRSEVPAPILPEPEDYRDELYAELVARLYADYMDALHGKEEDFRENKELMAAWAHEIKTPITAAGLVVESMGDSPERDSLREELDRIGDSVERMLFLMRSDSFSKDYLIAEEALGPLVRENVKKHSTLFIRKRIRLTLDVPQDIAVYTDRKWLLFILDQLLSNALKYTPDGGQIDISARRDAAGTVLSYRDSGRGIPREDIERVFAKSFTGHNGRESGSAATGLGLYLAQKLARKLNHRLAITSELGQGTTAEVHFPLLDELM